MSAGLATLNILSSAGIYEVLEEKANYLVHGLAEGAKAAGVSVRMNRIGSLGCGFFTAEEVCDFESALKADTQAYAVFFQEMLKGGIYMAPSQFEAFFVSLAHEKSDLDRTVEVAAQAFERVREHSARG
jgi:glutamate-1-semialdehyde 2,1-aminomutase